jgi:hypothetical protein
MGIFDHEIGRQILICPAANCILRLSPTAGSGMTSTPVYGAVREHPRKVIHVLRVVD